MIESILAFFLRIYCEIFAIFAMNGQEGLLISYDLLI